MARGRKIGDVYAIPLPDGTYAFGRVLLESSVAFYKHKGKDINDLPPTEDYEFTVGCYKDCFKEWTFVENRPFDKEDEARPPLYQMKDIGRLVDGYCLVCGSVYYSRFGKNCCCISSSEKACQYSETRCRA